MYIIFDRANARTSQETECFLGWARKKNNENESTHGGR